MCLVNHLYWPCQVNGGTLLVDEYRSLRISLAYSFVFMGSVKGRLITMTISSLYQARTSVKRQKLTETLDWLSEHFPQLFRQSSTPKQLKIGILDDIVAVEKVSPPSYQWLKKALGYHTSRSHYLAQQIVGAPRFDLEGCIAGEITVLQATHALKRLNRLSNQQPNETMDESTKIESNG